MGQCIFAGGEAVQLVGLLLDSPSGVPIGECVSAEVVGDDDGGMPGAPGASDVVAHHQEALQGLGYTPPGPWVSNSNPVGHLLCRSLEAVL